MLARRLVSVAALASTVALAQNWEDPFGGIGELPPYTLPTGYHDPVGLVLKMQKDANAHKDIASMHVLGQTHEGRAIPYLVISDNHGQVEAGEARVFLGGAMHGDEAGTQELLVKFQEFLLDGYGRDPRVTRVVDGLGIYIAPALNPDGVALGRRTNARGVDLNRDCPAVGTPVSQEVRAVVELFSEQTFRMGLAFHAGGAAFVLPWDDKAADGRTGVPAGDELLRKAGHVYASRNPVLARENGERFLEPGVVRGFEWYPVPNSLPDCLNARVGVPMASVEVGLERMPTGARLEGLVEENREALLGVLELLVDEGNGL